MSRDEQQLESEIKAKGVNAPRLTPADIDAAIVAENTFRVSDVLKDAPSHPSLECLTICVLTLRNGFTVIGTSACASPENYNAEIGNKIARDKAREQIWPLEGYLLRERLASGK